MARQPFYRNIRARDHLELFLVSAVSSLLLLRLYLYLTGYPQVGGASLHISHMLWGGALMLISIVLMLTFLGVRVQRLAALLGGIGFGIFIDELGKFITNDNNYFFTPTIGLIYAIFIILYLTFNFLSRADHLTPREYELNALAQFEETILHDMDRQEKRRIHKLLERADQNSPTTKALLQLLSKVEAVPPQKPHRFRRWMTKLDKQYEHFWSLRNSQRLIGLLFVAEAGIFILAVFGAVYNNFDDFQQLLNNSNDYTTFLLIGQLISSLVAGGFVVAGAIKLFSSRLAAFELFRKATLINLLLTQFFIFSRIQFDAMPGFIFNLLLLLALRYAIYQEQRSNSAH